jgi:hypothetical protein
VCAGGTAPGTIREQRVRGTDFNGDDGNHHGDHGDYGHQDDDGRDY